MILYARSGGARMNDRELLEYVATQVGSLTQDVGGLKKGLEVLDKKG